METIHCKVRVAEGITITDIPERVRTMLQSHVDGDGEAVRELPEAELEVDDGGIWATFHVPSNLGIDDNNQVEVTAVVGSRGERDGYSIISISVKRLW